jgi:hypothetical protein
MSFNITAHLRDIDAEIEQHRKEIAKHRLWISELEDHRLMLMKREENRAVANGHASPFGALPGVEIAVREQRPMLEDGALSRALKTGKLLNSAGNRRGLNDKSKGNNWVTRVTTLLRTNPDRVFDMNALIEQLGAGPLRGGQKQPIYQAIHSLKQRGQITAPGGQGTYQWITGT